MTINNAGNVGIGTAQPKYKMVIVPQAGAELQVRPSSTPSGGVLFILLMKVMSRMYRGRSTRTLLFSLIIT